MRRFCILLLVANGLSMMVLLSCVAQEFSSTQYYSNLPSVNPGFTGIDDYLDLKISVNQGWNSFNIKNNNLYVSANTALSSSRRSLVKSNALRISSPSAYGQIQTDKQLRRKHGMGGMISGRNVGPYRSVLINYNYAYHIPLSNKFNLALGTRLSYLAQRIDFSGFTIREEIKDEFYQKLILSNNGNQNSFLMDFGTVLYSGGFYLGLSTNNLIKSKLSTDNLLTFDEVIQYQMQTGGSIRLDQDLLLNSAITITSKKDYPLGWAINSRMRYKELLYAGLAYDSNSKLSFLFGMTFNTSLSIHYAYDQYTSSLSNFNVNTHELVLGLSLFNRNNSQPKFW